MSAFLGPIHYWLYNKIQLQENLTEEISSLDKELYGQLDSLCGAAERRPLEEVIDTGNIHGWLQEQIILVESRFASAVTHLLEKSSVTLETLKNTAHTFGASRPIHNYASVTLAEKGEKVKKVKLEKGDPYQFYAVTASKASAFVKKGSEKDAKETIVISQNLKLPLKKGEKVGRLEIYAGEEKLGECDLVCDRDVAKADFFTYYIRKIKNLFN